MTRTAKSFPLQLFVHLLLYNHQYRLNMASRVAYISDSMLKYLEPKFESLNYRSFENIHCIPGSEISEIGELVSRYSMDSGLIVINAGINDLLKGFSVQNCLYSYDVLRKKIKNVHPSAHVAFTSISYIADNKFDAVDLSNEINPLVDALNTALDTYCTANEYTHFIELRSILSRDGSSPIDRCNLCFDGLHYSTVELSNLLC